MKRTLRPVLRYHGGKFMLGAWILSHFPAHRIYVEPYCGAASILMQKPRAYSEVISDLDGDVVNLFRVLRDPAQAKDLANLLRLTPYARAEFDAAYQEASDPIERARRLIIRSFMGFGSAAHNPEHKTGFRSNSNRSGTTPAHDWTHYPDYLPAFVERLSGVVVENRPALEVIGLHDTPGTLHYVDPPYLLETRPSAQKRQGGCYRYEMTEDEHVELLQALIGLSGMVALSSYPHRLYDDVLLPSGWQRIERRALADGAQKRTEVLWLNPAAANAMQQQLDFTDECEEAV